VHVKPPAAVPPTVPDDTPPRAATTVDDAPASPGVAMPPASTRPDDADPGSEAAVLGLLEATRGPARALRIVADLARVAVALAITVGAWHGLARVSNTDAAQSEPARTLLPALLAFVVTRLVFRLTGHRFVRPLRGLS
jgi:hypothetical protein